MIFHEIYGCYYRAVARMLSLAIEGHLTENEMNKIAAGYAFDESMLTIVPALKNQKWQLIRHDYTTPIRHQPSMPLTELEKRWLKTILQDPRVRLFPVPESCIKALEAVEPLFEPSDIVYFNRYLDGDLYQDPDYVDVFRNILEAVKTKRKVLIEFISGRHKKRSGVYCPLKIEYSDKEDRFRVLCAGDKYVRTINIGRIIRCTLLDKYFDENTKLPPRQMESLVFRLVDERNCLERVMMRFSHLKKQVERIGEKEYEVRIEYDKDDTNDILIQLIAFGAYVTILEPESLIREYKKRIQRQLTMMDW